MILINLEDTFVATSASEDFKEYTFDSTLTDKSIVSLKVEIISSAALLAEGVEGVGEGWLSGSFFSSWSDRKISELNPPASIGFGNGIFSNKGTLINPI